MFCYESLATSAHGGCDIRVLNSGPIVGGKILICSGKFSAIIIRSNR